MKLVPACFLKENSPFFNFLFFSSRCSNGYRRHLFDVTSRVFKYAQRYLNNDSLKYTYGLVLVKSDFCLYAVHVHLNPL